jgi:hypothetical protein
MKFVRCATRCRYRWKLPWPRPQLLRCRIRWRIVLIAGFVMKPELPGRLNFLLIMLTAPMSPV